MKVMPPVMPVLEGYLVHSIDNTVNPCVDSFHISEIQALGKSSYTRSMYLQEIATDFTGGTNS